MTADGEGNRRAGEGDSIVVQGRNNLVVGGVKGHTVALLGCEDMIVVHTAGATLVMPRGKAEELKALHAIVRDELK